MLSCLGLVVSYRCERWQSWEGRQWSEEPGRQGQERRLPKGGTPGGRRWQSRWVAPASGRWPGRRRLQCAAQLCEPFST
jgi:hypothetical protein